MKTPLWRRLSLLWRYLIQRDFFIAVEVHGGKKGVGPVPQPHEHEAFGNPLLQLHQLQLEEKHGAAGNSPCWRHTCSAGAFPEPKAASPAPPPRARVQTHLRSRRVPSGAGRSPLGSRPRTSRSSPSPGPRSPGSPPGSSRRGSQTALWKHGEGESNSSARELARRSAKNLQQGEQQGVLTRSRGGFRPSASSCSGTGAGHRPGWSGCSRGVCGSP